MADDDLLVTISGPALSMLLYENARCQDQIGFLLGELQIFRIKKVTDSERAVENIQTHINIKSIVAHPMGCEPFFNTTGQLFEDRLKEFLKDDIKRVVGWYHYRYNYKLVLNSLRDRNLFRELSTFFSKLSMPQQEKNFLFFLMGTTENETKSTHKFKHVLYRRDGKDFKPVSFQINNLGADASRPDGTDYKPKPSYTSCQFDSFNTVYDSVRNDLSLLHGVEAVQLIEKSAEAFLAKIVLQVNKSDKTVSELSEKLFNMKQDFYKRQFEKMMLEQDQMIKQMKHCSMEVENESPLQNRLSSSMSIKSEPQSPESPLIFDGPKTSPSSSDIKMATKKILKQEKTEEHLREFTSRERETNRMKRHIPKSPDTLDNAGWKTVTQRKSEYLEASSNSTLSYNRKSCDKSPDYNTHNS